MTQATVQMLLDSAKDMAENNVSLFVALPYIRQTDFQIVGYYDNEVLSVESQDVQLLFVLFVREFILTDGEL